MRARIVRLAVIASVLALAVFAVPLAVGAARYYVADERSDLEADTESAASVISGNVDGGVLPSTVDPISAETTTGVYALDGQRVAGNGPDRLEPDLTPALSGRERRSSGSGEFAVALPLTGGDRRVGVLRGSRSSAGVTERTLFTWLGMVALASAALLATFLVARRLAARMAVPVEELARDAGRLGDGDFTVRGDPSGIDEIDALRNALSSTADRLADLVAREQAFSAEASHQLRTPLAGLRLQLEDAATRPPERVGPALDDALETTDRLHRTVEDLLRLARDARQPATPIDVHAVVADVVGAARGRGHGRTLTVNGDPDTHGDPDTDGDGGTIKAAMSEAALRQILEVLVDNAVVHGTGEITLSTRWAGDAVAVEVADEGGTARGESELFARRSATAAGHGIGLALARRLAEAEGGRLRLRSATPTTFTLLLPGGLDGAGENPARGVPSLR